MDFIRDSKFWAIRVEVKYIVKINNRVMVLMPFDVWFILEAKLTILYFFQYDHRIKHCLKKPSMEFYSQ
jgi:hypothetical protein